MFHGVDLGRSLRKMHELEAAHVDRPIQSMSIQLDGGDETQHLCIGRKLDDPALNVVREHAFLRKLLKDINPANPNNGAARVIRVIKFLDFRQAASKKLCHAPLQHPLPEAVWFLRIGCTPARGGKSGVVHSGFHPPSVLAGPGGSGSFGQGQPLNDSAHVPWVFNVWRLVLALRTVVVFGLVFTPFLPCCLDHSDDGFGRLTGEQRLGFLSLVRPFPLRAHR